MTITYTNSDGSLTVVTSTTNTDDNTASNTATPAIIVDDPAALPPGYGQETGYETSFYVGEGTPAVQGPNDYGATATGSYTEVAGYVDPATTISSGSVSLPTFAQVGINGGDAVSGVQYGTEQTAGGFNLYGATSTQQIAPGYAASTNVEAATPLTTPTSTDSNGTTTPGGDSVGGTTDMSSPGGAAPSGSSAAAGGGGC